MPFETFSLPHRFYIGIPQFKPPVAFAKCMNKTSRLFLQLNFYFSSVSVSSIIPVFLFWLPAYLLSLVLFVPQRQVTLDTICIVFCAVLHAERSSSIRLSTGTDLAATHAPVADGCLYSESGSHQTWSCIKTCNTDKCNTGSDGTILAPPTVVHLLVFATPYLMA